MNSMEPGNNRPEEEDPSWAQESLPMVVRRQLLERELRKLAGRHGAAQAGRADAQQQQGQTGHPSADAPSQDEHGG